MIATHHLEIVMYLNYVLIKCIIYNTLLPSKKENAKKIFYNKNLPNHALCIQLTIFLCKLNSNSYLKMTSLLLDRTRQEIPHGQKTF